jgi:circadian clock protein KaiC
MTEANHGTSSGDSVEDPALANTGIHGLDEILGGGLPRHHSYLVQGPHGSGKTTLGLQFLMAGARQGERGLYFATCESEEEVREISRSHGWDLDGVVIHYHDPRDSFQNGPEQSVFLAAEMELPWTMEAILAEIDRVDPQRLVIDSLSEIRLLSSEERHFRRKVLDLKEHLMSRKCTTLFCDEALPPGQPVDVLVHGVIDLNQTTLEYGPDRRRLRIAKLRGRPYSSGLHDFKILTGGLEVYPRLTALNDRRHVEGQTLSSGIQELDRLFGGGIDRGTASVFLGPSGSGKSVMASQYAVAAALRGQKTAMYVLDERINTLLARARGLGMDLEGEADRGMIEIREVDPAELTPGEFSDHVRRAITDRGVEMVVIDSLVGYRQAMPEERWLSLYLHELLGFLNQQGVTALMVLTQHGLPGTVRTSPFDISYIADSVLLFHIFEFGGELRKAVSVYKRRGGGHEPSLRELRIGPDGVSIGEPLSEFRGITTGLPQFSGERLLDVEGPGSD